MPAHAAITPHQRNQCVYLTYVQTRAGVYAKYLVDNFTKTYDMRASRWLVRTTVDE